ncbi:valine--tRNA ligase [Desertibaculum subflavum]|uniref:valine--tRNA ligase n=1 Tax=Desertibaculum subflavum TaxID=2268458 RepID=UPI000E66E01D
MLEKTYRPDEVEPKLYAEWEQGGSFRIGSRDNQQPYCIVIPPPNVTGNLHIGHALNNTLQDVLIRFERMRGRDVLWQPGTDHAGIATQMVVERQLDQAGTSRHALGRDDFVKRVWAWKEESGGAITGQLRRLGSSCDWSRERFTMDDGLSKAVLKVFVDLYKDGLIYRDKRLVNWDPKLHTAISDLEVEQKEIKGSLWYFRYPVEGMEGRHIVVATTRPETMLGDTGIAVHPDDERYKDLIGRHAILPLVGRRIAIVADEHADPSTGSGAVKITPAHDFNDFEVGKRHDLPQVNIFDADAKLNGDVPDAYRGLSREAARKKIVADLEALGLIEKIEPHTHTVPHGDRSGVVVEPWLTDQWYVDAKTLAQPAIEAVEQGRTVFVPKTWEKTFFEWMRNIQPWCISRQLWWGHQIPAWYGPDGHVFVELSEAEAEAAAASHYGRKVALKRDEDVLDTWFSSALWPFSTLGWPEQTKELARYYPTDTLVTGFDIIFFWVARMMMMGLRFMGEVPFRTVYVHALVRDERGQKMSKSKGNVVDPLALVDKYGADALRFTLSAMAAPGRDVKLSERRIEGYRNFATKIWNAARFCEMNGAALVPNFKPADARHVVNRWIIGELAKAAQRVTATLEAYRFDEAASAVYQFIWDVYCDWYLELAKPLLAGEAVKAETQATAMFVLMRTLGLLHPFMPFVTEELWQRLGGDGSLMLAEWPEAKDLPVDEAAVGEVDWVVRLIREVRAARAEMNVPAASRIELLLLEASEPSRARLATHMEAILRLARLSEAKVAEAAPKGSVQIVLDGAVAALPLAGVIDLDKERARLARERDKASSEAAKIAQRLANPGFVEKAAEEVVEEARERLTELTATAERLDAALTRLAG